MKHLKTVILENFQSHKYTSVNFDEGLNVILGASDSGKTAIIRGIKWALYNEPAGDFFIREGEKEASVTLIFSDNTKIKRSRSKSKNSYILYKNNGDEIRFEGFGTSVPEEIIEETGIKKIKLDSESTNAINIAEQLEGPFLLTEKNSTRAGAIGRLIGVNLIDDALKETLKDIRNLSNTKKVTENRILNIEDELKEYEYLTEVENKLKKAEELQEIIHKRSIKLEKLILYKKQYSKLSQELETINLHLVKLENIEKIDPIVHSVERKINNYKYLKLKRDQYKKYQNEIKISLNLKNRLVKINHIDDIIFRTTNLLMNINKYKNIRDNLSKIFTDKEIANIILNKSDKLSEVEKILSAFEKKSIRIERLKKLRDDYNSNQANIKIGTGFIRRFDNMDISDLTFKNVNEKHTKFLKLQELASKIRASQADYENENKNIIKLDKDINIYIEKYKELLTKVEICPFCLSNIDNKKIEHIISHYN